ncbi:MAG: aldolase/citrate lyase family protein [Gemmatimonadota bacterium]
MRSIVALAGIAAIHLGLPDRALAQAGERLNPVIALQEKGLPVFGISHPAIQRRAGRGGGAPGAPGAPGAQGAAAGAASTAAPPAAAPAAAPAAPQPEIVLSDVARQTVDYKRADYVFTSGTSDTFLRYLEEMRKVGGSMRTHPFSAKIGIWHANPAGVQNAIIRQLNAGHASVSAEAVESAQEVRDVIKAMRFASAGGTRPDTGLAAAAAYWGLTVDQYKQKADVWPINKRGELLVSVIIESKEGIANAREIAAEPGVGQIFVGYGTLGSSVFRDDPAGREAAAATILAACKEYKVPCGFPTNTPAEMEQRMKEGWTVHIIQRRDEPGMAAIETGRKLSKR